MQTQTLVAPVPALFTLTFLPLPTPESPGAYAGNLLRPTCWAELTASPSQSCALPTLAGGILRLFPGREAIMFGLEVAATQGVAYLSGAQVPTVPLVLAMVGHSAAPAQWAQLQATVTKFQQLYAQMKPRESFTWQELPAAPPAGEWLAIVAMPGLQLHADQAEAILDMTREIGQLLLPHAVRRPG